MTMYYLRQVTYARVPYLQALNELAPLRALEPATDASSRGMTGGTNVLGAPRHVSAAAQRFGLPSSTSKAPRAMLQSDDVASAFAADSSPTFAVVSPLSGRSSLALRRGQGIGHDVRMSEADGTAPMGDVETQERSIKRKASDSSDAKSSTRDSAPSEPSAESMELDSEPAKARKLIMELLLGKPAATVSQDANKAIRTICQNVIERRQRYDVKVAAGATHAENVPLAFHGRNGVGVRANLDPRTPEGMEATLSGRWAGHVSHLEHLLKLFVCWNMMLFPELRGGRRRAKYSSRDAGSYQLTLDVLSSYDGLALKRLMQEQDQQTVCRQIFDSGKAKIMRMLSPSWLLEPNASTNHYQSLPLPTC